MRKFILIFLIFSCFFCATNALADTGTYQILDYKATLTPHSSGEVGIDYYQKWLVTGGHIPWITVGVPNSDFTIIQEKNRGAIKSIKSANESGWSGIRIDLDKDYKPNETFEVWFSISQKGLFYADKTNYRLDFIPGWYDRANIDNLTIEIVCFAKPEQIKASPEPLLKKDQKIIWEKKNLAKGERFKVEISFPKTLVKMDEKGIRKAGEISPGVVFWVVLLLIVIVVVVMLIFSTEGDEDESHYSGGHYSSGGLGGRSGGGSGSRSSGGGGGFGGRSYSCACACVSCACACACAGGGGAGCSRKIEHTCPLCLPRRKKLWQKILPIPLGILILLSFVSCSGKEQPYDTNIEVLQGEPAFTSLGQYWVIDKTDLLNKKTIIEADKICQQLKEDGIAEIVVLIQNHIKQPEKYTTHYGRWLKLGKRGLSTEGGNNGIVWLIRPDAQERITISVGRGLPKFTAVDYGEIMEKAKDYINFNNFDAGALLIVKETDKKLREIYKPKGGER